MPKINNKKPRLCPDRCPSIVRKGEGRDRCRKGFWRESDPFKYPLYFQQTEKRFNERTLKIETTVIAIRVVRPPECKGSVCK